jgi:hypothetical protein
MAQDGLDLSLGEGFGLLAQGHKNGSRLMIHRQSGALL